MPKHTEQTDITEQFMATDIIMQPTASLVPYANNARTHSEAQIKQIAASIQSFGFTNPVLVDGQNGIIAGHGRILAAELLGLTEVPTICLPHLTNTAKRAYVLADNRIAINSGWDMETLAVEVQRIIDDGRYDVGDLGFDSAEVDEMLNSIINGQGGQPLTDPDDVPEVSTENPRSKRGDIWLCGEHRVMCGDSTDRGDVDLLMDGRKADMVFTDPPYGVSIGSKNAMLNKINGGHSVETAIVNDDLAPDELYPILKSAFENCKAIMNDCCALYATAPQGGGLGLMMMMMMKDAGLEIRHVLMWVKNSATFSMGRLDCDYQHEPIMFTWKKTHNKVMGGEHKTSCWFIDKPRESKLHPTMKPVELVVNALLNSSEPSNITFDPFLGSGTTLIACQSTNRTCYGMEISPAYVDVIVNRWQNFTGLQAVHAITGVTFNDTPTTQEA